MKNYYFFFFALLFCFNLHSQNDLCANATSLTVNTNCVTTTGSFSGSSNAGTTTSCVPAALQDVWYSFVATDPTMSISLSNGVSANLGMEIFTGSCGGASFACDNNSASSSSEFYQNNTFTVGQTYYVRVFHVGSSFITGSFTICVQNYPTPSNDLCANAIPLTVNANCVNTLGAFSGSGNSGTTTSCVSAALQDVWYSFVATDPTMSISLSNGVNANLGMEIFMGSCGGASFACDNNSASSSSEFYQNNTFTVGQTYYVRVFHVESVLLVGSFNICVQNYPTPANDLCANAIPLTVNTNCVNTLGTFSGSGNAGTTTSCVSAALQDVWYSFVATDPTMSISLSNGVNANLGMEIFTGSCAGASFACDNNSASSSSEFYQNNTFTVGQTYYVRVFHVESVLLVGSFNICVQNYPTPSNDLCADAIPLTVNTNCVNTLGTFSGSGNSGTTTSCVSAALQDVWYSFVATDPTMSISLSNGVNANLGMEIFTGSCGGASFACDNNSASSSSEFYQNNTFTVGQTYYVRVFHVESVLLVGSFNICVQNYPTPSNDLCADAIPLTVNANCVNTLGTFSGSGNAGTTTSCVSAALQDVWYSFVATDPMMSITIANGVNVNLAMEIFTGSCGGASFACDNSSASSSSEFYQNNTFTVGQTYYVRVFHVEALLTSSFTICVVGSTLNQEEFSISNIEVVPNPVTDVVRILNGFDVNYYELYNYLGQKVKNGTLNDDTISLQGIDRGVYFLKLFDGANSTVRKIIKQ